MTGLGVVSPLGIGAAHAFQNLVDGKCGIVKYDAALTSESDPWQASANETQASLKVPSKVAALVPRPTSNPYHFDAFDSKDWISKEVRFYSPENSPGFNV